MKTEHHTICDLLLNTARLQPEKIAITHLNRSITYRELYNEALNMKLIINRLGIKRGEMVGIYLDKSIEQIVALFAASMAGAVFVIINSVLKNRQINHIANDCSIKLIITEKKISERNIIKIERNPIYIYLDQLEEDENIKYDSNYLKDENFSDTENEKTIADDIACLIYTSGSTGMPKGVVVPHRTVVEGAEIVSSYLNISENDRLISVLPLNFDYGLNQVTSAILKGATLILHNFVMIKDLLDLIVNEKITGFAGLAPIWSKIFNSQIKLNYDNDFRHLRYITNTGGKVPRIIIDKMRRFFPNTQIFLMYGLTEAFRSTFLPPSEIERRPDSIGKAIPNVEILVVNEDGDECKPGEEGQLVHRGALITYGYWKDQKKTQQVFRKNPRFKSQPQLLETVVYSGDIVKKDEDGFLYFVYRGDEMIKSSGYRVSPTEIEEALIGFEDVSNVVVFSKEKDNAEQEIIAVIETNKDDEFKNHIMVNCRKNLPNYMVPHIVYIEKEFKKTSNGKIDRSFIKNYWCNK